MRNGDPTDKIKTPLELAGPVNNESVDGFKYVQSSIDVCTGTLLVNAFYSAG